VLIAPAVIQFSIGDDKNNAVRAVIAIVAFLIIATAVIVSKRRQVTMGDEAPSTPENEPANVA
jgi:K(+)-stimulated pyrophosphate-energized sodium pump